MEIFHVANSGAHMNKLEEFCIPVCVETKKNNQINTSSIFS